jgi:hypothetical protein
MGRLSKPSSEGERLSFAVKARDWRGLREGIGSISDAPTHPALYAALFRWRPLRKTGRLLGVVPEARRAARDPLCSLLALSHVESRVDPGPDGRGDKGLAA